jgi:L-ascorbate metabolism protein UlaG (beta-lactamase superfamily)
MKASIFFMIVCCMVGCSVAAADQPAPSRDEIETAKGPLVVWPVEHATFVMRWDGTTIVVDPVGGAAAFADHPQPDLVLITHTHGDHLSISTVTAIAGPSTPIIAPAAVAGEFPEDIRGRVSVIGNGETIERVGVTIEAIPMYNLTEERSGFHPKGVGNGYVLTIGGKRIYVAGDTEDVPEMRALEEIDAAFVCMNLPYTMDVAAAADAVLEFKPKVVYPYHYRGKGGMSDLGEFQTLVAEDPAIDVRVLAWY